MAGHAVAHDDHHDHDHRLRPEDWPSEELMGRASAGKVGMWIFLLSDALMFAGFLLAYGILRGGREFWICTEARVAEGLCQMAEPELGINFTAALTFLLICSSVAMVFAYAACLEGNRKGMVKWLGLTILGGALFLCGQYEEYFGIFGHGLVNEGLIFGQSAYASTFYLITSFHGCHVLTGVIYLIVTFFRARRGAFDDGFTSEVEILGLFWHFVDLVWILVFTLVYLIPE